MISISYFHPLKAVLGTAEKETRERPKREVALKLSNFFFINQLQHPRYINKNKQQQKEKGDVHQNLLNKKKQRDGD
jgi:capsule polysaccharide export protein KpsC/LpsZ